MSKRIFTPAAIVAIIFAMLGIVAGTPAIGAQSLAALPSTPSAASGAAVAYHPAHIHKGTCDNLGDIVYPLNDLQAAVNVATPDSTRAWPSPRHQRSPQNRDWGKRQPRVERSSRRR